MPKQTMTRREAMRLIAGVPLVAGATGFPGAAHAADTKHRTEMPIARHTGIASSLLGIPLPRTTNSLSHANNEA